MRRLFLIALLFSLLAQARQFSAPGSFTMEIDDSLAYNTTIFTLKEIMPGKALLDVNVGQGQEIVMYQGASYLAFGLQLTATQIRLSPIKSMRITVRQVAASASPSATPSPTGGGAVVDSDNVTPGGGFETPSPTETPGETITPAATQATTPTPRENSHAPKPALACYPLPETQVKTVKKTTLEQTGNGFKLTTLITVKNEGESRQPLDLNVVEQLPHGENKFQPQPSKLTEANAEWAFSLSGQEERQFEITTLNEKQPVAINYDPPQITTRPMIRQDNSYLWLATILLILIIVLELIYWKRKKKQEKEQVQ